MIQFILQSPDFLMWAGFILLTALISKVIEARKAKAQ